MKLKIIAFTLGVFIASAWNGAAQGTAFTYQGVLNDTNGPATGIYDLRFAIYDAASRGSMVGNGAITNAATPVTNGLFTVTLDFGGGVFDGNARWLEIGVQPVGGTNFTGLAPRQSVTAMPYAMRALNAAHALTAASANSVSAANITGMLPLAQLPSVVLTNGASDLILTGTFSGSGTGLTNLDLLSVNSRGVIAWSSNTWSSSTLPVGRNPMSVIAADLHGTGKPDLISANHNDSSLTIWNNNGSGEFLTSATVSLGLPPNSIATADVNGDGKLDIICAVNSPNAPSIDRVSDPLMVLTNDGSGGFVVSSLLPTGNSLYWYGAPDVKVAVADVNGDGKPDLIAANANDNSLTVFTNNGSSGFAAAGTNYLANAPWTIATADINGDGKVDLIAGEEGIYGGAVTVLTNAGGGRFVVSTSIPMGNAAGWELTFVTAADVNGDGKPDVVAANLYSDTLTVLLNNGSGGFDKLTPLVVGGMWDNLVPDSVAVADMNHDGMMDLVCTKQAGGIVIFSGNGHGGYATTGSLPTGSQPGSVMVANLNGDAKLSVICANSGDNTLSVIHPDTPSYQAAFVGNGAGLTGISATNITSGTLALAQLPTVVLTNNQTSVNLTGSFSGDASGLTNFDVVNLSDSLATNFWKPGGNNVTDGQFIGSTNNQALEFKVNGRRALRIEPGDAPNIIGGCASNTVGFGLAGAFIGGGSNQMVVGHWASILGGLNNTAGNYDTAMGKNTTATGGYSTTMGAYSKAIGLISTAMGNQTTASGDESTAMGYLTTASGSCAIAMGTKTKANGDCSTAMGFQTTADAVSSTAMGDQTTASGAYSTAIGRGTTASGYSSTALGNETTAGGDFSTAMGYRTTAAGFYSMSAGTQARANHKGTFVWADSTLADFASTGPDQFLIRASGGVGIGKSDPATALDVNGTVTALAFSPSSDRNLKENFIAINPLAVLEKVADLKISQWNFKTAPGAEHIGPMAQDFKAAFGTGADDKHIATVDADGVALAAIQGLNEKVEARSQKSEVRMQKLEAENAELKQRLAALEKILIPPAR
ncbi:MAG: FG-GAP-like repeat-containing protein [Verrucomicrobiota bacterium]